MNTPDPVPPTVPAATMPWWRSQIIVSIAVSVVTHALAYFHVAGNFTTADVEMFVNDALNALSVIAMGNAVRARVVQKASPQITLTKTADPAKESKS